MAEPKITSATVWAWIGTLLLRGAFYTDGVFRTLVGFAPDFDPTAVRYIGSRRMLNVAAHDGHLRITGDAVSAAAFDRALGKADGWGEYMTLEDVLAHPFYGKTAPSIDVITAAYAEEAAA